MALVDVLQSGGHVVVGAANGAEAMKLLEGLLPDLILLDLDMPVMNGCEFLDARALSPALSKVPVIVLSARIGQFDASRAAMVLEKPIRIEALFIAVDQTVAARPVRQLQVVKS